MESWGWANVSPEADGKFSQAHQVSPTTLSVTTTSSTDASDEGPQTPKDRRAAAHEEEVHQVSPVSTSTTTTTTSTDASSDGGRLPPKIRQTVLEQEVARLRKKYNREVNLHKALDRALQRPVGVLPRIPSYLPVTMQKLLAEVALLEEEVIRLEDDVVCLHHQLSDESSKLANHGLMMTTTATHKPKHQQQVGNDSKPSSKARVPTKSTIKDPPSKVGKAAKPSQAKPKDHSLSRASKSDCEDPTASVSAAGNPCSPPLNATPGPRKPPAAAAEANGTVSKGQGQQQPWKPLGGMNNKRDVFRQPNALSCADAKPAAVAAKKLPAPRIASRPAAASLPNLPLNRSDKPQSPSSGPKSFATAAAPRPAPRVRQQQQHPITGMPSKNLQLREKENLQSSSVVATATKLTASKASTRGPKLGLTGGDLFSSNVDRRSRFGHKV